MRIAIYGRDFNDTVLPYVQQIFDHLKAHHIQPVLYHKFKNSLHGKIKLPENTVIFHNHKELSQLADVLLSLGGDGTLLDTLTLIRNSGIPVIGINFGRLGFLASINKDAIESALQALINKEYTLDARSLLSIESEKSLFGEENFALNDMTIHRRDNSAMMIIHASMNGEFVNSYWADGLIIATPTGSTAYSLSCGGPIIYPDSQNFVVTPIAPHNLNVRPVVLPDNSSLSFEVEARESKFLVSCDSRTVTVERSVKMTIKKADFCLNLIRLNNETYLSTLRNKLLWGIDTRNY
ncbi:NAD kinase [Pedobacter changchengzhani]|uniref:NAD kinase n=1 Tax=Pedobacter changchengzhani TaxID=2529274 RepID=A0A4R5MHU9_9SPHI|nr:NAD kinase [Pedobacter changchengzhani]TDG35112.1 NAD kinase [Pedobacter changchengzhani]